MIGILIAVSINNWKEERKQDKVIDGIFTAVINDIKSDTTEVNKIIEYYDRKVQTFHKVMNDTLSKNEIINCEDCRYLITGRRLLTINTRGFQQLNKYSNAKKHSTLR